MTGPYRRKKHHDGDTHLKKRWKTKRRTKDLDQIEEELKNPTQLEKLLNPTKDNSEIDFDRTGLGKFYCVHCAKDLADLNSFSSHIKGKPHKRRLHALKTEPYTIKESELVAGLGGSYIPPTKKRLISTLNPQALLDKLNSDKIEAIDDDDDPQSQK